jgi:hypothetical protein
MRRGADARSHLTLRWRFQTPEEISAAPTLTRSRAADPAALAWTDRRRFRNVPLSVRAAGARFSRRARPSLLRRTPAGRQVGRSAGSSHRIAPHRSASSRRLEHWGNVATSSLLKSEVTTACAWAVPSRRAYWMRHASTPELGYFRGFLLNAFFSFFPRLLLLLLRNVGKCGNWADLRVKRQSASLFFSLTAGRRFPSPCSSSLWLHH